jgi:hypothetical protein
VSKRAFEKLLHSDEVAGRVIKLCAVFESRLDFLLVEYFALESRPFEFYEHVISRLGLFQKLEILQGIELGKGLKSRSNFISSMKSLRKLRNALAHNFYLREEEIIKLYSDQNIKKWLLNYPKALSDEKRNMEVRIGYLWNAAHKKT